MRKINFNFEKKRTLEEVCHHYELSKCSINKEIEAIDQNAAYTEFLLDNFATIEEYRKWALDELSHQASFSILTILEAKFRTDFIVRTHLKLRDPLSVDFRNAWNPRMKPYQVPFKDTIISCWCNNYATTADTLNQFNQALDYRNWIAHGRYWRFKDNINKYTFQYIHHLALTIEAQFENLFMCPPPDNLQEQSN